jgi:hypothetical protein
LACFDSGPWACFQPSKEAFSPSTLLN